MHDPQIPDTAANRGATRHGYGRRELIGSLREDFNSLAARIISAAQASVLTVWADDECRIYGARPEALPHIPVHWIIGTYACGAPIGDIAADLDAERTERVRAWRLD